VGVQLVPARVDFIGDPEGDLVLAAVALDVCLRDRQRRLPGPAQVVRAAEQRPLVLGGLVAAGELGDDHDAVVACLVVLAEASGALDDGEYPCVGDWFLASAP